MTDFTDFTDFNSKVNLYFDKQLDRDQEKIMFTEVEANPDFNRAFSSEKNKRTLLKSNFHRTHVTSDLIQNIRSKIQL